MTASQPEVSERETDRSRDPSDAAEDRASAGPKGGPSQQRGSDVPLDVIFTILKNERRRRVLRYMLDADGRVTLSDLAEHVAAIENDTTPSRLGAQQRKRVYIGLYQSHLPKMDDAGVVEFDRDRGVCELGPDVGAFTPYLEPPDVDVTITHRRYLVTALGGGLLYAAARLFELPLLGDVVVVAMVVGIAGFAIHHRQQRVDADPT
jgi:hypothetical protein